jgi:hypothetical protein
MVPRELLERLRDADRQHLARLPTYIKRAVMSLVDYLAAPSPAPVIEEIDTLVSELRNKDAIVISGLFHCVPIMGRAADTIDSLRAALVEARELHRMQMVAIDVIAMCNTKPAMESWAIQKGNPNWTPTYDTVREALEREMVQRERAEQAESALAAAKAGVAPRVGEERQQQVEDADYIIAKLEQRVLPEHGGTAHSMTHHWNLTVDDSAMHQEAAALIRALKGDTALKSKEGGAG